MVYVTDRHAPLHHPYVVLPESQITLPARFLFFFVPTVDYKNCMGDGINCTKSAGVSIILNPNWQGIAHVNPLPIKLTLKPPLHSFHEYLRCRDLASL